MKIMEKPVTIVELKEIAAAVFGDMIKGVVDVRRGLLALDAELHSDLEALLLESGSLQEDLWGINLYPDLEGDDFIEFDSMINMRPSQGNMGVGVEDPEIRSEINTIIKKWVKK
jgi:hypothetical protein